jgi:hypothetical protein
MLSLYLFIINTQVFPANLNDLICLFITTLIIILMLTIMKTKSSKTKNTNIPILWPFLCLGPTSSMQNIVSKNIKMTRMTLEVNSRK